MENQTERRPTSVLSTKQTYLFTYNAVCFALWSVVTLRAALFIPVLLTHDRLYTLLDALFPLLKVTQSLAFLEVIHAALGLVRASLPTTALQVTSRLLLVWGILDLYPTIVTKTNALGRQSAGTSTGQYAYAGILMAWGFTEIIRYGYFVWREGISERIPSWLTWLRYNTFFVLYPVGISSECWLINLALEPAKRGQTGYDLWLKAVLLIYVPGSYVLYTHMMSQRRRVLKGKNKKG